MGTRSSVSPSEGGGGEKPEPYYEQQPFMKRDRPYFGFVSGSGAGKTFAGVYRLWLNATMWNPDSMGAIIVPDKSQFTDNIKPILEDFGLLQRWEYKSVYTDEPGLVTGNGQRILILSADNERQIGRIKGKNLAYVWMDEEAEIIPRAREHADQRLRVGNYPNLFITTTPNGYNHTYDFFVGDVDGLEKEPHGRGTLYKSDDKLAIVGVPSEANPILSDEDIARMRRNLPNQVVAQEIEGGFVEIGSGVLTRDMLSACDGQAELDSTELTYTIGVDLGIESDARKARDNDSDYWAAAVVAHHRRHGEAFVADVSRRRGMSMREGLEWIESVMNGVPSPTVNIESVHAQQYLLQEAQDRGLPVQGIDQNASKESRLIQLSVPFESGRIKLCNFNESPENGPEARWDDFASEWVAFPDGSHDDLLDAVEIALRNVDIGQTFGGDALDMYGRDDE